MRTILLPWSAVLQSDQSNPRISQPLATMSFMMSPVIDRPFVIDHPYPDFPAADIMTVSNAAPKVSPRRLVVTQYTSRTAGTLQPSHDHRSAPGVGNITAFRQARNTKEHRLVSMSLFLSPSRLLLNLTFMLPKSFIVHNLYTRTIVQTDQGVLYAICATNRFCQCR